MKQITINTLAEMLKNWHGSAAVGLETLTVPFRGNKSEAAAILAAGYEAKKIIKRTLSNVLVTNLSYRELVEKRKEKEVMSALAELQVNLDDVSDQFAAADKANTELEKAFPIGNRTNGEALSGALVISSKDQHPMLTAYFTLNKPIVSYEYDGKPIDVSNLPFFSKEKPVEGKKQMEYGIDRVLVTRNYRLENVKKIRMYGEHYTVTA